MNLKTGNEELQKKYVSNKELKEQLSMQRRRAGLAPARSYIYQRYPLTFL